MKKINSAAIIPNTVKDKSFDCTDKIIKKLNTLGIKCFVPDEFGVRPDSVSLPLDSIYSNADCLIILGGDGTILKYAVDASDYNVSILGVNIGTIGFICEINPNETDILSKLASGDYSLETRYMLDVDVIRNGRVIHSARAMNDAVIENCGIARILEIKLSRDGKPVNNYRADGLILSTPTGSTAYSLAAGGPIVDPGIALTLVTPVCPHTLTAKPMLFDMNSRLTAEIGECRDGTPSLNVDGRDTYSLNFGDIVRVTKSKKSVELIKLKSTGFYDIIYDKLAIKI